jgi:hypothetical protein
VITTLDSDSTARLALLLSGIQPAEIRSATDIESSISTIFDLRRGATQSVSTPTEPLPLYFDPWIFETLDTINSFRDVSDGWDGDTAPAPTKAALKATEKLAAFLARSKPERRPALCVDALGRPAFATNIPGFYIHLTVGESGLLTWYALSDGVESFADEIGFDGRNFPEALRQQFLLDVT